MTFAGAMVPGAYFAARWRDVAVGLAVATGLVMALVVVALAWNYRQSVAEDPLNSREYQSRLERLRQNPRDEALKEEIRRLDLRLRTTYFQRQARTQAGGWALVACAAAFLASLRLASHGAEGPPLPAAAAGPGGDVRRGRLARWAVGALAMAVVTGGAALGLFVRAIPAPRPEPVRYTDWPELAKHWPRFRGADGSGVSPYVNVPTDWDGKAGRNILWKAEIPLGGESSPIVWGGRVFLTGADDKTREVFCFDALSGGLLWRRQVKDVPGSPAEPPNAEDQPGLAAPTPACDGERVYAIFGNLDLACFSADGRELWKRNLGPLEINYGYAASLSLAGKDRTDLLLVMLDQAAVEDVRSRLVALDVITGRTVWQAKRPVAMSWTTPIVIDTPAGRQIVTSSTPHVMAHRVEDGKEIWRAEVMDGEVAPSPVYGGGKVFAANGGATLAAVRPDGTGDVTKSHVAWRRPDEDSGMLPDIASPLADPVGERVFLLTSNGLATCVDGATGEKVWEHSLGGDYNASPSLVGDRLYVLSTSGVMHILSAGREFKSLGRAALGEGCTGSPAFADGRIYLRGKKHLFCIGSRPE